MKHWRAMVQARWEQASAREQRWLSAALALVSLAPVWWLAVAPALQALPTLDAQETRRALEASIKLLGAGALLTQQMDRVTVTLKGVSAPALAQWLSATRQNAHVVPTEAHLKRASAGGWDGTVVFTLAAQ